MPEQPATSHWFRLGEDAQRQDPYGWRTEAVAFAMRAGHSTVIAHRFTAYLARENLLGLRDKYPRALREVLLMARDNGNGFGDGGNQT